MADGQRIRELARRLHDEGSFTHLARILRAELQRLPQEPEPHVQLGRLALRRHRFAEAQAHLRRAAELAPDSARPHGWLVAVLHWQNLFQEGLLVAAEARGRWPEDVGLRVAQARLHLGLGDYPAALALTEPVEFGAPDAEDAVEWRLTALRNLHRQPEAEQLAEQFLALRPDALHVQAELVDALTEQDRHVEAVARSAAMLAEHPRSTLAARTHADALARAGNRRAGAALLAEQVAARPHLSRQRHALGHALLQLGDYEQAAEHLAVATRLNPGNPGNWWPWISALRSAGQLPAARAVLTEALRRWPAEADLITEHAELVEAEQDATAALPIAESALGLNAGDTWTPQLVARLRRETGQATEAEALLRELVTDRPDNTEALRALGRHLRELDREEEVVTLCRAQLDRRPGHAAIGVLLGSLLRSLGRAAEAAAVLRACLAHRPRHAELLSELGLTLERQGDHEAAAAAYREATEGAPLEADFWNRRLLHLLNRGRLTEAEPLLATAMAHCPDSADLHLRRAYLLRETAADEIVEAALRESAARFPDSDRLRLQLVWHLIWGRRHLDALSEVDSQLAARPEDEVLLEWRARLLFMLNRRNEGRAAAEAAHRKLPESAALAYQHAWSLIELDQEVAAEAALLAAHTAHPEDLQTLRGLVRCLRRIGRRADAEAVLRAALAADPAEVELHLELAWTLEQQLRLEEAIESCDAALALDAEHEEATGGAIRLRYQAGLGAEAERLAAEALSRRPWQAGLWQEIAAARLAARELEGAVTAARRAVELTPGDSARWLLLVDALLEAGQGAEAARVAAEGVRLHPRNPRLRVLQAGAARAQGREAEAETLLRQAVAELPEVTSLGLDLAAHLRGQDRHEEVLALLDGLAARDPGNAWVPLYRVRALRSLCRFEQARTAVDAALAELPWFSALRVEHARLLVRENRIEAALAEYQAIEAVDPMTTSGLDGRVECLYWLGRRAEAERALREGIQAFPDEESLRLDLVQVAKFTGRFEEAFAELDLIQARLAPSAEVVQARARLLLDRKRFEEAAEVVAAGLRAFPQEPDLMLAQGQVLDAQNRHPEALDCFDRMLARHPLSVGARTAKSATLRSLGRFREARELLDTALAARPNQPDLLAERGWVHRDQGRLSLARKDFGAVLGHAADPDQRMDALRGLGWVDFADGDFPAATARFRAAAAIDPEDLTVKGGLAWTLVRGGEFEHEEEAERLCLEVLARDPADLLAHTCVGVLYARQRDYPLAEHHLRRTVELDPFNGSYVDLGALLAQLERFTEAEELFEKALARDFYDAQAHIELGSLLLQRDQDGTEPGADARAAAQHFRQALLCEPRSGAAATGLALALARSPGDLVAAERVLREALARTDCDSPAWGLQLTLARLLVERGDATQRREFHLEALALAQQAISAASAAAEPYFVAGVAAFKIAESGAEVQARPAHRRRAVRFLRRCLERDPGHVEARRLVELATHSLAVARRSLLGSAALMLLAAGLLAALWLGFFLHDKVNTVMVATLTPVLVGLVALGFVLPLLVKLKLPGGVEADLAASMSQLSSGPTGELSYGPGRLVGHRAEGRPDRSLNAGPRGELPRLG